MRDRAAAVSAAIATEDGIATAVSMSSAPRIAAAGASRFPDVRVTIVAIGSRGDVQPLIALGAGLAAAGVTVRMATHADFADAVRANGLDMFVVGGSAGAFFGGAAGVALRDRLVDAHAFRRTFDHYLSRFYDALLLDVTDACRDADAVICWPWTRFATSVAEAFRVPVIIACQYPPMHLPTRGFANPYQHERGADTPAGRRRTWRLALPALQMGDEALNRWRVRTLRLAPMGWREDLRRLRRLPICLGFSSIVVPRPADWAPWIRDDGLLVPRRARVPAAAGTRRVSRRRATAGVHRVQQPGGA